jgi:hypothetical protein
MRKAKQPFAIQVNRSPNQISVRPMLFFTVDTCVLRCYKPQKDKLFGGESPIELQSAVRE